MRRNEKSENYLHITAKSERGRRALVVASQTVGVLAECRPPRRPFPFVSGQSFLFPMPVAFELLVIPLPLSVRVFRLELITTSSTRRANQEEKNMIKKNNYVSRCNTSRHFLEISPKIHALISDDYEGGLRIKDGLRKRFRQMKKPLQRVSYYFL